MGFDEKDEGDVDNKDNSDSAAVGDNIDWDDEVITVM